MASLSLFAFSKRCEHPGRSDTVLIYNLSSKEASNLQSSIQDPTCIAWAKKGEMLGVGTQKGLVVLHHASQKKETPIRGLHTRAIVSAAWSVRNDLITVSEDKNMSVLGSDSSLKMTQTLRSEPNEIRIGAMRDEHARRDAMQSKVVISATFLIVAMDFPFFCPCFCV